MANYADATRTPRTVTEGEKRALLNVTGEHRLYEHRGACSDPLQKVEEVYADFGYPESITGLVRYMPMEGPDLGSKETNEARLFQRWKRYLDDVALTYMS